jgi:hypothetical protein
MRVRGASSSRLCSRRAVAALALVALICGATLAGSARSQRQTPLRSGPPFALDAYTRMVVKYYEGIKLNDAGDRAVLYDDLGKGKGNCTIGWGRLVHKEPCDGRGSEKPYALLHRGSFLVRESFGLLVGRGGALGGLLRVLL